MIWPLSPKGTFDRAQRAAKGLKPGSWEAVEALAQLALSAHEGGRPEASALLKDAQRTAGGLKEGSWESVRALALLDRCERALGGPSAP